MATTPTQIRIDADIKKQAMDELGMQYAKEDQIVTYNSEEGNYVRQYIEIDE